MVTPLTQGPRVIGFIETGRENVGVRVWEEGMGRCALLGTEFQFCKTKNIPRWMVVTLIAATHVKPLSRTLSKGGHGFTVSTCVCVLSRFSRVRLSATPWAVA